MNDYVNITKAKICPACGATNRIRYDWRTMMVEAPCSSCGALVKWKRKMLGAGGSIKTAFEDDTPELVDNVKPT
ncbi:MAG: hypothetical protein SA339_05795 [Methanomassiliicoccus sp.]|nr:hypothetical protein [Methanomassiliicoccus sp.]